MVLRERNYFTLYIDCARFYDFGTFFFLQKNILTPIYIADSHLFTFLSENGVLRVFQTLNIQIAHRAVLNHFRGLYFTVVFTRS